MKQGAAMPKTSNPDLAGAWLRSTAAQTGTFAALAYALSWACWLPLALSHRVVVVGGWPTHLPGLLGPAVAAFTVALLARGGVGVRVLAARVTRWRIGWWWLVAVSPLALLAVSLLAQALVGHSTPSLADFGRINGFPIWGAAGVLVLLVVVNGLGEETGWRGFLQPLLQRSMRPLAAMLVVAVIWACWHAPLFAILTTFRGFTPATLFGFAIGLVCGAIVLGWLYNRTGSVLAVAVWHATYNLTSATDAAHGLPAAVSTTVVIIVATGLVIADLVSHGRVFSPTAAAV
jgi:membrane protease YdiL (CAAX protease family)